MVLFQEKKDDGESERPASKMETDEKEETADDKEKTRERYKTLEFIFFPQTSCLITACEVFWT